MMRLPEPPEPLGPIGAKLTSAMICSRLRDLIDLSVEGQRASVLILQLRYLADVIDAADRDRTSE